MPILVSSVNAIVLLLAAVPTTPGGEDDHWPMWRGPHQDGVSTATGLPLTWSADDNIVWKTPLPSWGGATPIVWGDRIFVTSPSAVDAAELERHEAQQREQAEQQQGRRGRGRPGGGRHPGGQQLHLLCVSAADGEVLWQRQQHEGNRLFMKSNNASPSPVTDGEHVWSVTGTGQVTAYDMDGETVWERNLQEDYGEFGLNWGYASSPLLYEDLLIVQVLHGSHTDEPSYVIAFDAATGENAWRVERVTDAPRESPDSYTTPLRFQHGGHTQIVITGGDCITGHDPYTGDELWRVDALNPRKAPNYRIVASPVAVGDMIYAPTRVRPLTALRVREDGSASAEDIAWQWDDRGAPDVPTPTCDGKYFYMVDDSGMASCLDAQTGAAVWGPERTVQGTVSSSPLLADGKLYFTNEEAVTVVLAAGPEFQVLATNELDGSHTLSSPVAVGSRLYVRTGTHLYCIGD